MISFAYCETHPYLEQSERIDSTPSGKHSSVTLTALRTILPLDILRLNPFLAQNLWATMINLCYQDFVFSSAKSPQTLNTKSLS